MGHLGADDLDYVVENGQSVWAIMNASGSFAALRMTASKGEGKGQQQIPTG
jgi:hypothetical protein